MFFKLLFSYLELGNVSFKDFETRIRYEKGLVLSRSYYYYIVDCYKKYAIHTREYYEPFFYLEFR